MEHPIVFTKKMKELCDIIHIQVRDKWRVLINNFKAPCYMKANRKLKRKYRILSASPNRKAASFIEGLSWASKSRIIENKELLAKRIMMREQVMKNLNIDGKK